MDFIVDAMLPLSLSELLNINGYNSIHTSQLPQKNKTSDNFINELSLNEKRVVITKDSDFENDIRINHKPYKLVLITTGNISNSSLLSIFKNNLPLIIGTLDNSIFIEINEVGIIRNF